MARPQVKLTWTANYQGTSTSFRLVQDDAAVAGAFTIEKHTLDKVGGAAWITFVGLTSNEADRSQTKLTPNVLTGLLDAVYPV